MKLDEKLFLNEDNFVVDGFSYIDEVGGGRLLDRVMPEAIKDGVIRIPDGITKISSDAFTGDVNLGKVLGSDNNIKIVVPEGVTSIDDKCFAYVVVKEIDLPMTLEHVGDRAFANNPIIEELFLPNVLTVGSNIVEGCEELKELGIGTDNIIEISDSFLFDKDGDDEEFVPSSLEKIYLGPEFRYMFGKDMVGGHRPGNVFQEDENDPGTFIRI